MNEVYKKHTSTYSEWSKQELVFKLPMMPVSVCHCFSFLHILDCALTQKQIKICFFQMYFFFPFLVPQMITKQLLLGNNSVCISIPQKCFTDNNLLLFSTIFLTQIVYRSVKWFQYWCLLPKCIWLLQAATSLLVLQPLFSHL